MKTIYLFIFLISLQKANIITEKHSHIEERQLLSFYRNTVTWLGNLLGGVQDTVKGWVSDRSGWQLKPYYEVQAAIDEAHEKAIENNDELTIVKMQDIFAETYAIQLKIFCVEIMTDAYFQKYKDGSIPIYFTLHRLTGKCEYLREFVVQNFELTHKIFDQDYVWKYFVNFLTYKRSELMNLNNFQLEMNSKKFDKHIRNLNIFVHAKEYQHNKYLNVAATKFFDDEWKIVNDGLKVSFLDVEKELQSRGQQIKNGDRQQAKLDHAIQVQDEARKNIFKIAKKYRELNYDVCLDGRKYALAHKGDVIFRKIFLSDMIPTDILYAGEETSKVPEYKNWSRDDSEEEVVDQLNGMSSQEDERTPEEKLEDSKKVPAARLTQSQIDREDKQKQEKLKVDYENKYKRHLEGMLDEEDVEKIEEKKQAGRPFFVQYKERNCVMRYDLEIGFFKEILKETFDNLKQFDHVVSGNMKDVQHKYESLKESLQKIQETYSTVFDQIIRRNFNVKDMKPSNL